MVGHSVTRNTSAKPQSTCFWGTYDQMPAMPTLQCALHLYQAVETKVMLSWDQIEHGRQLAKVKTKRVARAGTCGFQRNPLEKCRRKTRTLVYVAYRKYDNLDGKYWNWLRYEFRCVSHRKDLA